MNQNRINKNRMIMFFSVIIAVTMMLSWFSATVFASGDRTHVYELYQIFTGTISSDGVLSDVKWGQNGKKPVSGEPEDGRVSSNILNELETVIRGTDTEKLAVITKYVDFDSTPYRGEDS